MRCELTFETFAAVPETVEVSVSIAGDCRTRASVFILARLAVKIPVAFAIQRNAKVVATSELGLRVARV